MQTKDLGLLLLAKGLASELAVSQASWLVRNKGGSLLEHLVALGEMSEDQAKAFLSEVSYVPKAPEGPLSPDLSLSGLIPPEFIKNSDYLAPFKKEGRDVVVLVADTEAIAILKDLEFATEYRFQPLVATFSQVKAIREALYPSLHEDKRTKPTIQAKDYTRERLGSKNTRAWRFEDSEANLDLIVNTALMEAIETQKKPAQVRVLGQQKTDDAIVNLVDHVLRKGIAAGASDIHFEPQEDAFRVRYRLDGRLVRTFSFPVEIASPVVSRIKILSQLDIAEKRLPQDGRIHYTLGPGRLIDIRVSTVPTFFGEKAVLRLLDKASLQTDVRRLGMEEDELSAVMRAIQAPQGMVLVTGPTGSGKTTTLYSMLTSLNKESVNIMTAEDPIEFDLPGINQMQIHEEIGLTFASAIRSFLRQDPDIILVGEIRDFETADIAIKAALTGHLVLSTLHTNDAPSVFTRLVNMNVEPYLVASSVVLVMAQRLLRKLCPHCKRPVKPPAKALIQVGFDPQDIPELTLFGPQGCPKCFGTGYTGRVGIFEVLAVNDEIREMFLEKAPILEIKREAKRFGMRTLRNMGLQKAKAGITSLEEVTASTMPDR